MVRSEEGLRDLLGVLNINTCPVELYDLQKYISQMKFGGGGERARPKAEQLCVGMGKKEMFTEAADQR